MYTLSSIHIYPLKGGRGTTLTSTALDRFGPSGDRRWMLVDPEGQFVTQRQLPGLARVAALPTAEGLRLSYDDVDILEVPFPTSAPREVTIWNDTVGACDADDEAAAWFSARLDRPLRLVYLPDDARRLVNPAYAKAGETVSLADGYPLLLVSAASLDELNARLSTSVGLDRFRPNLVVAGCAAHAEDDWQQLRIGEMTLTVAKPCDRCTVPALDQRTGERHPELLRALASYRRAEDRKVYFGQNLLYAGTGTLHVGDPVHVL
ncbi:MAG: MOSC N-terminal beta barrel domain-containing protein [Pseudomonadota bacterium]